VVPCYLLPALAKTNARYDATRDDVDAIIAQPDTRRTHLPSELLDARFAPRDKLSAVEWAAMYQRVLEPGSKP